MQYRLIIDRPRSPWENMALDEAILIAVSEGLVPPTLRLYTWDPYGLSLGHFQSLRDVLPDRCRFEGVEIVRRLTGGNAILHGVELTYSFSGRLNDLQVGTGILESCRAISQGLLYGLERLRLPVYANYTQRPRGRMKVSAEERICSPACFLTAGEYEVMCRGRKLVGSAQTRRRRTLLQHGSIPIRQDIGLLFELLSFCSDDERIREEKAFTERATDIYNEIGNVTTKEMFETIAAGFIQAFPGDWEELGYQNRELELLSSLSVKYRSDDWNNMY